MKIYEGVEVTGILLDGGRVSGVRIKEEEISSPIVVNAGDPYAALIGKRAGVEIPVKPLRRQIFITAPFKLSDQNIPLTIDFHRGWYFRPDIGAFGD